MFKNASYNQLKKIRFITFIFAIIAYTAYILFRNHVPQPFSSVLATFMLIGSIVILLSNILFITRTSSSKRKIQDEASRSNDKDANTNTLLFIHIIICCLMIVTVFTDITITLDSTVCFFCFAIYQAVNDGCYLYLERRDMKYAGTDDED